MKYHRRHSRWYERFILNPVVLISLGAVLSITIPALKLWGWNFWLALDSVRVNTMVGAFSAFVLVGVILYRFLRYPGTSAVAYVMPTVTCVYSMLVSVFLFSRMDYSRQVLIESFLICMLSCWLVYFFGRGYRKNKYAVVPVGKIDNLLDITQVEWRVLDKPDLGNIRYDAVVADFSEPGLANEWERFLAICALSHIPVYHTKQIFEALTGRVKLDHLHENQLGSLIPSSFYSFLKRSIDLFVSIVAIPCISPVMLITALLIKWESPGPVLFLQERVGQGNRCFFIYKFRSMFHDSEKNGAQFAQNNDMRVTRVGAVIRQLRIDELPQFFNVLKGDMSLIGPRPEQRVFVEKFEKEIPFYSYRHIVRPGISGWAQVMHGYAADTDETKLKIEHDFFYIKNFSLWLDILIMFKTVRTIVTGFGSR